MTRFGLDDATVRYGTNVALDAVTLRAAAGRVVAVVGADGAGKTTLARVLVGLVELTTGRVRRPDRRAIGYQPEGAGTWADLTVAENLAFVAAAHGLRRREAAARTDHLLEVAGLVAARARLAGDLSGGMRQKLAVALGVLGEPQLLVLDEATTGLDPVSRAQLWRLVVAAAAQGGAAVVVTSAYLDEAERADEVVVLDQGRVLVVGEPATIRSSFPGFLVETGRRDDRRPSWRRGRHWRTWVRSDEDPHRVVGRLLQPDLEDVVMAAAATRRAGAT